ncbi:MAG: hypothetical protein KBE23_24380 [Chloroflexi bacterium]|nr:hypothetical protein [bacterium]MBP7045905.1 hypothetical protein [Chloroflexota bacterium]
MRSQKFWFVCLLLLGLLGGMMGCQSSGGVDEETRAQITALTADLTTVQADIAGLNTRSANLAGQTAAAQGTIEALSAASVAEATVVPEAIPTLEMSLRTALEVIYQDGQPAQSAFFPLDRLVFYRSLEAFQNDWAGDNQTNSQSRVKVALLTDPTADGWQLYYTTDVISDTVTWAAPGWRRYLISANWSPVAGPQAAIVSAAVLVDQGETQPINGQTPFVSSRIMLESLQNLNTAVTNNGGDLTASLPIMFLIYDSTQGRDDFVLAIVDALVNNPHPRDDPATYQYCLRCQGFWCGWRCWRY